MNVLGPCALNKSLSPCIVQYCILMSDDGEETDEEEAKKIVKRTCVHLCVCHYRAALSAILLFL